MSDTYNKCKVYRRAGKRFRKLINNGFSKRSAGANYRSLLKRTCKVQCDNYKSYKDTNGTRYFNCVVCDSRFTNMRDLDKHQQEEHRNICKWFNSDNFELNKEMFIHQNMELGDFVK
jgi:hypothetical protein